METKDFARSSEGREPGETKVRNFIIGREEDGEGHEWLSVRAASGFWSVRFRDDNPMYGNIRLLMSGGNAKGYLEAFFTANYLLGSTLPDLPFLDGFYECYAALSGRMAGRARVATPEDDAAALEDVRTMMGMEQ